MGSSLAKSVATVALPAPDPSYDLDGLSTAIAAYGGQVLLLPTEKGSKTGEAVMCMYLREETSPSLIIYTHGNAADVGLVASDLLRLREELHASILAVEYPGYGPCTWSSRSIQGVLAAAERAYTFAVDEAGYKPANVVCYGRSIGTGPAVHVASKHEVGGLILMSAYTSLDLLASEITSAPRAITSSVTRAANSHVTSNKWMASVTCRSVLVHGLQDNLIPCRMSEELHAILVENGVPAKLVLVEGMGHNNITRYTDSHTLPAIREVLATAGGPLRIEDASSGTGDKRKTADEGKEGTEPAAADKPASAAEAAVSDAADASAAASRGAGASCSSGARHAPTIPDAVVYKPTVLAALA